MAEPARPARRGWRIALGAATAVIVLLGCTEAFLRFFPPSDLHPYLGEASPTTGIYRADPDLGINYRDWAVFRDDNAQGLKAYLPFQNHPDTRPTWAFFGNSFVHAPGMLADLARSKVTERKIFNLGRNELLPLRFAQVRLLLENGLAPERIFFELMPVDVVGVGQQPLDTMRVTARGALAYDIHAPSGPVGWLIRKSRVGLTAWVRSGKNTGNPRFNRHKLYDGIDPILLADLRQLFGKLAELGRKHQVPVTVMLIPAYHQIAAGASFNFQDALKPMLREVGLDVFDPRDAFCSYPKPEGLFIPDKHFNDTGNDILLRELRRHVTASRDAKSSERSARSNAQ